MKTSIEENLYCGYQSSHRGPATTSRSRPEGGTIIEWPARRRRQSAALKRAGGERRSRSRYTIELEVRWKLLDPNGPLDSGFGRTLNLSPSGILFDAGRNLSVGQKVYLAISWPILLNDATRLQLTVEGSIVRTQGNRIAIHLLRHEFRTAYRGDADGGREFSGSRGLVRSPK